MQVTCPNCLGLGYVYQCGVKDCKKCNGTGWVDSEELYGGDRDAEQAT